MKKLIFALVGAVSVMPFAGVAATYYVDAVNGDDDWDGTAETSAADAATSKIGPRRTLAAGVKGRANGDVVIALPGVYDDGVSNADKIGTGTTLNRVTVPTGVTLKSRDGHDVTFIIGAATDGNGDATRCVSASGATVRGFTITGGHTLSGANGGGITGGTIIDCVVSNNVAGNRGGGINGGTSINCWYHGNSAGIGSNSNTGNFYGCLLSGSQTYQAAHYNCTFASDSYPRQGTAYNCLVLGVGSSSNASPKFYRCYHRSGVRSDSVLDESCVVFENAAAIGVDAKGRPTSSASAIIDKGDLGYYNAMGETARTLDFDGNPRFQNGAVDIGCYEHNPCADFSQILSPDQEAITVTEVSPLVVADTNANVIAIGTNQVMKGTLVMTHYSDSTMWSFFAEVKGSGTLAVYYGDEETPGCTVTAADGAIEVTYTASAATAVRFVYSGTDGTAEVSRFTNITKLHIDEFTYDGVILDGDITETGDYEFFAGQFATFTVARADPTIRACLGVEVNGVFYNFYDYPDGKSFTVDGSDRTSGINLRVVYAEGPKEWFVDAQNGDDENNCGLYTNRAFKTLARAASVSSSGDLILAFPGVYDEGVSNPEDADTGTTLNRVTVPDHVTLRALGSVEETVIKGAEAPNPTAGNGCGTNAVRCVSMNSTSKVIGFTITGGRTCASAGAGANGGVLVDCVVSNNVANGRGGGANGTDAYRCRFYSNDCIGGNTGASMNFGNAFCSYFRNGEIYQANTYNCTLDYGAWVRSNNHYNDLCLYDGGKYLNGPKFYNCYFTYTPNSFSSPVLDEFCVITNAAALQLDENHRPVAGSVAIDAGSSEHFAKISAAYRDLDIAGGQRVYNGTVDAGCGEFDWRDTYSAKLNGRGAVTVTEVSTGVVDIVEGQTLSVPAGEKMTAVLAGGAAGTYSIMFSEGVSVAVTCGGETVATQAISGGLAFEAAGDAEYEISVEGAENGRFGPVVSPIKGFILIIR